MSTATTVVAPEPEVPCQHLKRTDVGGKAGRQVCDNLECKQIFQDGVPVPTSVNSSPKSDQQEAPKPTKVGARRAKKARKALVGGKAVGAETINTNKEEDSRAAEFSRKKYIEKVVETLDYVVGEMKAYHPLMKAADDAIEARDTKKAMLQDNPKLAKAIQFLMDYFGSKPYNEIVTYNGHEYKSIKPLILKEVGCTYEYMNKMRKQLGGRLDNLLTSAEEAKAKADAAKAKREEKARTAAPQQPQPEVKPTKVNTLTHATDENDSDKTYCGIPLYIRETAAEFPCHVNPDLNFDKFPSCLICLHGVHAAEYPDASQEKLDTTPAQVLRHATEVDLHSVATRIQSAFNHALACAQNLSPAQRDEYFSVLIDRLQDERQPAIDIEVTVTTDVAESATA
jgi:hypothetical protein